LCRNIAQLTRTHTLRIAFAATGCGKKQKPKGKKHKRRRRAMKELRHPVDKSRPTSGRKVLKPAQASEHLTAILGTGKRNCQHNHCCYEDSIISG